MFANIAAKNNILKILKTQYSPKKYFKHKNVMSRVILVVG